MQGQERWGELFNGFIGFAIECSGCIALRGCKSLSPNVKDVVNLFKIE